LGGGGAEWVPKRFIGQGEFGTVFLGERALLFPIFLIGIFNIFPHFLLSEVRKEKSGHYTFQFDSFPTEWASLHFLQPTTSSSNRLWKQALYLIIYNNGESNGAGGGRFRDLIRLANAGLNPSTVDISYRHHPFHEILMNYIFKFCLIYSLVLRLMSRAISTAFLD
jgi:hypothetical protein